MKLFPLVWVRSSLAACLFACLFFSTGCGGGVGETGTGENPQDATETLDTNVDDTAAE